MTRYVPVDKSLDYKGRRLGLGLTQEEVSEKAGVSKMIYSRIERKLGMHQKDTLDLVNKALNLDK